MTASTHSRTICEFSRAYPTQFFRDQIEVPNPLTFYRQPAQDFQKYVEAPSPYETAYLKKERKPR